MSDRCDGFHAHGRQGNYAKRGVWTPLSVGVMVLGFIVYWPLGFAALAYNIWAQPGDLERWFRRLVTPKIAAAQRSESEIAVTWRRLQADAASLFGESAMPGSAGYENVSGRLVRPGSSAP